MDTLRASLLIIGIIIVVAIYFLGRHQLNAQDKRIKLLPNVSWSDLFSRFRFNFSMPKPRQTDEDVAPSHQQTLSADDLSDMDSIVAQRHDEPPAEDMSLIVELTGEQIAPDGEQLFIPITIMAKQGRKLTAEAIVKATQSCQFRLDDTGIFYYEIADAQGYKQNLLGMANIIEPGTFDIPSDFETPGMVLFLHLPAPVEARQAFEQLVEQGRQLADLLDADLCDEARSVLTNQTIGHLKEKVETFRFKQKMTQIKHRRP